MNPIQNPIDLSSKIKILFESLENLSVLYKNYSTENAKIVSEEETKIKSLKWEIIEFLTRENSFEDWLNTNNNNSQIFYNLFNRKFFNPEISFDSLLTDKLNTHIKPIYDSSKFNNINTSYDEHIIKLFDYDKCFSKNYSHLISSLSNFNILPLEINNILTNIKSYNILLKDHPYHFVINKYPDKYITLKTLDLIPIFKNCYLGNSESKESLTQLNKIYSKLLNKECLKEQWHTLRTLYNTTQDNKNKQDNSKTI